MFDTKDVEEIDPTAAWEKVVKADEDRDLDDFRHALKVYCKAIPQATYAELEKAFRKNDFNIYLIATVCETLTRLIYLRMIMQLLNNMPGERAAHDSDLRQLAGRTRPEVSGWVLFQ